MATEFMYLRGKASWVRNQTLNEWGKWSMCLHPDEESLNKIYELKKEGLKNDVKKDDDGYYVYLSRLPTIRAKNRDIALKAPEIFDGTRPMPDGQGYAPLTALVGNGSDVVVKMEVYGFTHTGRKGKAMRWASMRVDNLVPYIPAKDLFPEQKEAQAGLETVPRQLF